MSQSFDFAPNWDLLLSQAALASSSNQDEASIPMMAIPAPLPGVVLPPLSNILGPVRSYYDCSRADATHNTFKSRMGCLRFDPILHPIRSRDDAARKSQEIYRNLHSTIQRIHGSYGLSLRFVTFFEQQGEFWFVVVAKTAHYFSKWHHVNQGLGACETRVYYRASERNSNSICAVIKLFPGVTQQELMRNYFADEAEQDQTPSRPPPQASPKARTSKTAKRRIVDWEGPAQTVAPLVSSPAKRAKAQPAIVVQASPSVETPFEALVRSCVAFLSASSLDACHGHEQVLRAYLQDPAHRGQMGLYLLNNGLGQLHSQAAYLREIVLNSLGNRFGMFPESLSYQHVVGDSNYARLDEASRAALHRIVGFNDNAKNLVTFALYDRVSVLVYLSIYILRCQRDTRGRLAFESGSFLSSEAAVLAEVPSMYPLCVIPN
jgi:hypothetical protein